MYNKDLLRFECVVMAYQVEAMADVVSLAGIESSPFFTDMTFGQFEAYLSRPDILTHLVKYDGELIGYFILQFVSDSSAYIHWGVTVDHIKYLKPIMNDCFNHCTHYGVKTFLGTISVDNSLSLKAAEKWMDFSKLCEIKNYLAEGKHVYLMQKEV